MAGRLSAPRLTPRLTAARLLLAFCALLLVACVEVKPPQNLPDTPEEELNLQSRALQRTVQEATVSAATAGAGGAYIFGGRGAMPAGILIGIPVGFSAGTYVGYLQQQYATNEARLERLRTDVEVTNAETRATIATMRVVLERQRKELARLRAGGAGPALQAQTAQAEASLQDMSRAIDGAEGRAAEFQSTRGLRLVEGQLTGVDAQIAELTARIADMRAVAGAMAAEI